MANRYWVGGSGTWDNSSTANWSATSGGAAGASAPNSADNVFFDANSGTAATVTVAATAACLACTVNKSDINLSLSGSPTFSGTLALTTGTITLNSNTLTCLSFSSNNTNSRTVAFGTGKVVVTGNASNVWIVNATNLTATGSKLVETNYAGSTGTRNILHFNATESNAISLRVSAGTDIATMYSQFVDIDFTGFSGTVTNNADNVTIYGNLTLSSGLTYTSVSFATIFAATSGTKTITSNNKSIGSPVTFNGVGGTWTLQDNFTMVSGRPFTLTNGTFTANDKNVTVGSFALGSGTKTLTLGSGTWTCLGAWNANTNVANLTVSASTGTISMISASAKTFSGGAKTWPTLNQGGAGNLTIAQSNTFANITNTVQPATIRLTAGTTQTVSAFSVSGTSGNLITLDTTVAGTRATLSDPSGLVSVSFCSIKDINATGGAFWQAYTVNGNVDGGNNLGWDFNALAWSYMYNVRKSKRILPGV